MTDLDSLANAAQGGYGSAHPVRRSRLSPTYSGIVAGALMLYVFGAISIVGGILLTVGNYATLTTRYASDLARAQPSGPLEGTTGFVIGLVWVGWGFLIVMAASVGMAVRDIARNSFR